MKRALLLSIIATGAISLWSPTTAQTPTFNWARSLGNGPTIRKVVEDHQGRLIAIGQFGGTDVLGIGPDAVELVGGAGNSCFLAAFQADGSIDWAIGWGSTGGLNGADVAVAPDGSIVVTGYFKGTLDLDASPTAETVVSAGSDWDLFITKYAADGQFEWGSMLGNAWDDLSTRITMDGAGNVIHSHYVKGIMDMDPGPATVNFDGGSSGTGVMSKYAADGTLLWYKAVGRAPSYMRVLSNGSIMVSFSFGGQLTFGEAPNTITIGDATISGAQAIVRCNAQGDPEQGTFINGVQSVKVEFGPDGSAAMVGMITDEADLDPGPGTNIHVPNGVYDPFALRVNAEMEGEWGVSWGDDSSEDLEAMDIDGYGNVYIVAPLYGPFDVDPGPGTYILDNPTTTNGYLLMLRATDGTMGFANLLIGDALGFVQVSGIRLTSNGTIITHGAFRGTIHVDPWTDSFNLAVQTAQTEEGYICAYGQQIGLATREGQGPATPHLYPVPCTDHLAINGQEGVAPYRVMDMTGRILLSGLLGTGPATLDVSSLPAGAYHLQLTDAQGSRTTRFVKQ